MPPVISPPARTHATAFSGPDAGVHLLNEVARFSPAEIILNDAAARDAALQVLTEDKLSCHREIRETDGPAAGPASPPNSGNRPFRTSLPIITLLSWPWAIS